MLPTEEIRLLLREFDDPGHLERPRDFDLDAAGHRFARLTHAMEGRFGPSCGIGLYQDASVYGQISVPSGATDLDRSLWVELSNFGSFVTAGTSDWAGPGPTDGMTEEFLSWLDGVCTAAGCTFVPLELLLEPYDGPSPLDDEEIPTETLAALPAETGQAEEDERELPLVWADRYFQYV